MKTSDEEIYQLAMNYASAFDDPSCDCEEDFYAGFRACEARYTQAQKDMMKDAAKSYDDHEMAGDVARFAGINMMSVEEVAKYFFTAGRLSGLKEAEERIKELERELYRMNQFRKTGAPCDDSDFPNAKQLEQGE